MKSLLASIDRLPPADADAVRARVADGTRRAVEEADGTEWLPAELNLEVTRAIYDGIGLAAGSRFFRETMREAFSGPMLRVVVEAAQRVFRADAASFAGWVGTGWVLVFRDCGRWTVERVADREARLLIEDLPAGFAADEIWLASLAHGLDAFFDVSRAQGTVRFEGVEPDGARARYRILWS